MTYGWIGVPSAAGAHSPGVEKAPAALRAAGLPDAVAARAAMADHGDLPTVPFALDREHRRAQNAPLVARVARDVAARVAQVRRAGETPLVVGGDCTILLGVLAALAADGPAAVVYLDAHPDLNTPESVVQGALDWMGMGHALGLAGAVDELRRVGPREPLLGWDDVVFFGVVESELTAWERGLLDTHARQVVPATAVVGRATAAAHEGLAPLDARGAPFVVHFDVDVVDFVDWPIADNAYQRNQGLALDDALAAVRVFAGSPRCAGLVVTEVNPDHAPGPEVLPGFAARLAAALAPADVPAV